jgi:hypothetical protein
VKWIESQELRCTLEAGHAGEHWAKGKIDYGEGLEQGQVEIWWKGEADLTEHLVEPAGQVREQWRRERNTVDGFVQPNG